MSNPVLDYVLEWVEEGRHISSVACERLDGRAWQCRVEFTDWCHSAEVPGAIMADKTDLPAGIRVHERSRFPAAIMPLGRPSRDEAERCIHEVAVAGRAPGFAWIGDHRCLTKPIEWMPEPDRTLMLRKYHGDEGTERT